MDDEIVSAKPAGSRGRILVVNDTPEILELLRDILEDEGFEVVLYSYASRDLADVKRVRPDLIVLDFIIGGEDYGWQLLQKLKLDRETVRIPIVVCTAAVNLVRELEGHLRAKGVSVVLKPFDIDDLVGQVEASWRAVDRERPDTPADCP
jgi:DNA-binding response OmpR family regulator